MSKSKIKFGALLAVMLIMSMALVPAVSATHSDDLNDKVSIQKKQVAEALETIKSAQNNGEISTLSTASFMKDCVDALMAIVATVNYYDSDSRLDSASSELVTASNLLSQGDIEGAVPHILTALNYLWDYLADKGSQLPGWLYDSLVAALDGLYNLIAPYL